MKNMLPNNKVQLDVEKRKQLSCFQLYKSIKSTTLPLLYRLKLIKPVQKHKKIEVVTVLLHLISTRRLIKLIEK